MLWDCKHRGLTSASWSLLSAPLPSIPSDLLPSQQPFPVSACSAGRILSLCLREALHSKRDESEEKEVSVEQRREKGSCPALHRPPLSLLYLSLINSYVNRGQQCWPLAPCHARDQKRKQRSTKLPKHPNRDPVSHGEMCF